MSARLRRTRRRRQRSRRCGGQGKVERGAEGAEDNEKHSEEQAARRTMSSRQRSRRWNHHRVEQLGLVAKGVGWVAVDKPPARAGWVSMLLLEWLRNAVQPPGSMDHPDVVIRADMLDDSQQVLHKLEVIRAVMLDDSQQVLHEFEVIRAIMLVMLEGSPHVLHEQSLD